ncbi:MAG: glycerate kinase type-2 family protein [Candidatus Hodarchaeales archaeon]|jgi:glycerate-2-kinase
MRIQNYEEIINFSSSTRKKARETILDLFSTAVEAVDPYKIIIDNLTYNSKKKELVVRKTHLSVNKRKIWVIGAGKAVGRMAEALERVLTGLNFGGIICVPEGLKEGLKLQKIQCLESTHPLPSEVNIRNTTKILELIEIMEPEDLVIALISGGGSAIWVKPIFPVTVDDLITLNTELINSGMNIHEINVVRKHVSSIKGGKLAKQIPAEMLVLVLSDVIGDNLESIASGYFYPDPSTFHYSRYLLDQHHIWDNAIPTSVRLVIERGIDGIIPETPKDHDQDFQRVKTYILGSNKLACNAVILNAKKFGFNVIFLTDKLEGDARCLGRLLARIYCGLAEGSEESFIIVSGGEPTVRVRGNGIGGRNQEVVAALLNEFLSYSSPPDFVFLSAGTDGADGNSPYAGALVDDNTIAVIHQKELNLAKYQKENNLSKFFEKLGGSVLLSGPTGTNVMDLQITIFNASNFHKRV